MARGRQPGSVALTSPRDEVLSLPVKPGAARVTDVTAFEPWRTREGQWRPGKNGTAVPYASFGAFCDDLIEVLESRDVSTDDPHAHAAADRAERTLRTKQPEADPTLARRVAAIDAVKGGLPAFAPASFDGNTRSKETCERVTAYAADHDHEAEESWAAAVAKLETLGVAWFAYGSPKDGLLGVRRRLLIALSRDVTPAESARLRAIVPALLDLTPDASTVSDESRLFYAGTIDDAAPYVDGNPHSDLALDVDALLAAHPAEPKPGEKSKGRFGAARERGDRRCPVGVEPIDHARTLALTSTPAVQGEGGHTTLFNLACDIVRGLGVDPADALAILWDVFNPRCEPPWETRERKDFDRKVSEAQHCERERGYLLPDASAAAAAAYAPPGGDLSTPIFLRSKDGHVTLMWEGDEIGHRPIADKIITTRVEELGWQHNIVPLKDGKGREYRTDQLLKQHGATYERTAYAFGNTITQYDRTGEGRVVVGYPRTGLAPQFDADADAWLRALAGPHYPRLAVWIASCTQERINRLSACLILIGGADMGKSMFGHALALLWGQSPPPLELTCVQFNADLLRCPILVDEEAQLFGSKRLSTKRFRDIIQSPSRSVERKGKERCELIGAIRAVVSCNGYSDLKFTDLGGPDVIKALKDRMLVINALGRSPACRGPLARLRVPGAYVVDLMRVARHMAWICATTELPAERFIGAGGDSTEGAILAGHVEDHAELWESFRDWLEAGRPAVDTWQVHAPGLCVDPAALASSLEQAGRGWDLRAVRAALAPYHKGDHRHGPRTGRKRLWVLDRERLAEALVLEADDRKALEAPANPPAGRSRRFGRAL